MIPNAAQETERNTYNAGLRNAMFSYVNGGLVDLTAAVEDPVAPGKWISTGGIARTTDGIHPNSQGVADAIAENASGSCWRGNDRDVRRI